MMRLATSLALVMSIGATLLSSSAFCAEPPHSADISKHGLKPGDFPRWHELDPNVYAYEGLHAADQHGVIINTVSLIVVTGDGVIVVDGQGDVPQTRLMVENIRKLTDEPIKYVVIASDHGDHTGGNAAFKEAYPNVVFISSPASQKVLAKSATPPTMLVGEQRSLRLGAIPVEVLNLGRAHTGGDLVVWLPETNLVFMSEVFLRDVFPAMRSAYPTEWLETLRKAASMNASYYIAGHGFVDSAAVMRRELDESRRALASVIDEAERLHKAGYKCESPSNCPAVEHANWGEYADLALRDSQAPLAIWRVYQELEGKLPET
jgi:glyoxylase-like metal-dependent hydrolase (beta-lactamase superfamily II)